MINMNNESITLSLEDSFFLEKGKEATVEDYFKNIDERVNIKIAQGMKQAMHLIIKKLDVLIQNRLSYMVKDEVKLFSSEFKCGCPAHPKSAQGNVSTSNPIATQTSSPKSPMETQNANNAGQRQGSLETLKSAKSLVSDSELYVTKTPTLGAKARDDDREHHTQGPVPRTNPLADLECRQKKSDELQNECRRMIFKLEPEKAKTSLISSEMLQSQNEKLQQLIKSPMSSIAENNMEDENKIEPNQLVQCSLQQLARSSIHQHDTILGDSIIQIDQPTKTDLETSMQFEITENISGRPHHKRAVSNILAEVKLPPVTMNHLSVEIEKTNLNNEFSAKQSKLAKSPTSTSLSKRSPHSIVDGINSS